MEGFEPPNGGIKTRDGNQHNQQVAETTDRVVPLHTPRFPIAATKPATSGWLTADEESQKVALRLISRAT